MPAWINVLVTIAMVLGGVILNALYISYAVGQAIGKHLAEQKAEHQKNKDRIDTVEGLFIQRAHDQDKVIDELRAMCKGFIGQIAFLEGKLNGRERGGR